MGNPDPNLVSTSFVERQNLGLRTTCRRFTRLTNAFSKSAEHHRAGVALYAVTPQLHSTAWDDQDPPAVASGITYRPWSIADCSRGQSRRQETMRQPPGPARRATVALLVGAAAAITSPWFGANVFLTAPLSLMGMALSTSAWRRAHRIPDSPGKIRAAFGLILSLGAAVLAAIVIIDALT